MPKSTPTEMVSLGYYNGYIFFNILSAKICVLLYVRSMHKYIFIKNYSANKAFFCWPDSLIVPKWP